MSEDRNRQPQKLNNISPTGEIYRKYVLDTQNRASLHLDPQKVPDGLRSLILVAHKWGISDDIVRNDLIYSSPREDLEEMVNLVSKFSDDLFDAWLAGPEGYPSTPSEEYVAYSQLRMAFEEARWLLKHWDEYQEAHKKGDNKQK